MIPKREVLTVADLPKWEKSQAYHDYLGILLSLNEAVKNKKNSESCHVSSVTTGIISILERLDVFLDETPPIDQPQRFGNKAFRIWFEKLKDNAGSLLQSALPEKFHSFVEECKTYLVESFGNSVRIDYGSGHEMAFVMFLCCLFKIGALQEEDQVATVIKVFDRYMTLVRKLQTVYRMEPAGSHGVWSLDDYQFIPFIWGSSQLMDHKKILPKSFVNEDIAAAFAKDYMFLSSIDHILKVKTGPFAEHSNQLWNISAVQGWKKVNEGLIKMYKAEVLAKFPVVQHVLFGDLLSVKGASNESMPPPQFQPAL